MINPANKGALLAVASALALSTMGVIGKLTFATGASVLDVVSWRAVIAALIVLVYLGLTKRTQLAIKACDIPIFLVLGAIGIAANYFLFFQSLEMTNVATAITLLYTYPIMVTVAGCIFLGESISKTKSLCVFLAFCGVLLLVQVNDLKNFSTHGLGLMLGLGAAITKTIYTLISKRLLDKYSPETIIFYALTLGAITLLVFLGDTIHNLRTITINGWIGIVAIATVPTLIGYSLFVASMKFIEASKASIIALLEPVVATLLASLILQEIPTPLQLFGGLLVLFSLFLLQFARAETP